MFVLGCLLFSFAFGGQIDATVVQLCVFNAIMKTGCILFDLIGNVTVVSHFPTMRGPTIALMKSFVGIGGAIVSAVQLGFFPNLKDIQNFYYLLIGYAVVMGILELIFMRNPLYHLSGYQQSHLSEEEKKRRLATKAQYLRQDPPLWRFIIGYGVLIALIIYLPAQSACVQYLDLGKEYTVAFAIVTVIIMLMIVLVLIPDPRMLLRRIRGEKEPRESLPSPSTGEENFDEIPIEDDFKVISEQPPAAVETEIDYIAPPVPDHLPAQPSHPSSLEYLLDSLLPHRRGVRHHQLFQLHLGRHRRQADPPEYAYDAQRDQRRWQCPRSSGYGAV
ncbi:hypothetical protein AGDE_00260 [Angomonas deanei]|uniref:Nodulin-like, putative n=1 Tax=Angomonas deanei TaxID=59799 RepID=A0A7G2CPA1_9TRYP|nr:hypothetical protein AGDE_00260 [Angomonas deanei]CAD2220781.1 Nodulin-like, putative [Angomonas deanei]|eukprot:EPY43661.1 hypothetical protein AGDE_00260 [Angomonas deanei]